MTNLPPNEFDLLRSLMLRTLAAGSIVLSLLQGGTACNGKQPKSKTAYVPASTAQGASTSGTATPAATNATPAASAPTSAPVAAGPQPPAPVKPANPVPAAAAPVPAAGPAIPATTFDGQRVAQSHTSLRMQSGDVTTIWFEFLNTGSETWRQGQMSRLGTTQPADRPSAFVHASWVSMTWATPSANRPATVDVDTPTGARGRYRFTITAPQVAQRTSYRETFGQVEDGVAWFGTAVSIDIVVDPVPVASLPPVPVAPAVPSTASTLPPYAPVIPSIPYNGYLVAQSHKSLVLQSGDVTTIWFEFLNTGGATWQHGQVSRLGTTMPNDRLSAFANATWDSMGWATPSENRPATVDADTPTGARGRYSFSITAPQVTQRTVYREAFAQVEDGVAWFGMPGIIDIVVDPVGGARAAAPVSNTWRDCAPMPTPRRMCSAVTSDTDKIYCIGGIYLNDTLDANEEYDPRIDAWRIRAPMPTRRARAGAAFLNGKIYVVGGFWANPADRLDVVEEYDVAADTWRALPSLPKDRVFPTVVAFQGRIWSIGGWETIPGTPHGVWTTLSYIFDPGTQQWSTGPDFGQPLGAEPSAAVSNGQIVLFSSDGGATNRMSRIIFMPSVGTSGTVVTHTGPVISTLAPNEFAELGSAAAIGSSCYILGGRHGTTHFADLKRIDSVASGQFQTLAPMRLGRQQPGLAAAGGKLYVFGGENLGYGPAPGVEEYTP